MSFEETSARGEREAKAFSRRSENLALLYQGLLTGVVRMQAGRQHVTDADSFRGRTKIVLQDVERDAIASGYDGNDVKETHFAVVAFLDAVVLNSNLPIRAEWERRTLQEELVGKTDAGVVFFDKLDGLRSRRDSQELADVLEVYLLCLLLGFEGKYAGSLRAELYSVQDKIRARIQNIRGRGQRLSPGTFASETTPRTGPVSASARPFPYAAVMACAIALTLLLYLAAWLQLWWVAGSIRSKLG